MNFHLSSSKSLLQVLDGHFRGFEDTLRSALVWRDRPGHAISNVLYLYAIYQAGSTS